MPPFNYPIVAKLLDRAVADVIPVDFRSRWTALYNAVVRQESVLSRFSKRLVTPAEHKLFKEYILTYWDRLYSTVFLTGPYILHPDTASDQRAVLDFVIGIISKFMRAKTEAESRGIPWAELAADDNGWIHLAYPPGTHFAPGT